jgi:hypothetical protein
MNKGGVFEEGGDGVEALLEKVERATPTSRIPAAPPTLIFKYLNQIAFPTLVPNLPLAL